MLQIGHFLCITYVTLILRPLGGPTAIPAQRTMDLEIVNRALSGAFVRVSLSSVALLTGTHRGFLSDFKLRYVRDACPLEWANHVRNAIFETKYLAMRESRWPPLPGHGNFCSKFSQNIQSYSYYWTLKICLYQT